MKANLEINNLNGTSYISHAEEYWERLFQDLVEFKKTHGHCLGPFDHRENIFL
ncbi:MAG: helicase associated domain-containing protein [Bacteriovorax sp.]|nr:helicase associated domain-containing protein [Bacteriovorax sp.]